MRMLITAGLLVAMLPTADELGAGEREIYRCSPR